MNDLMLGSDTQKQTRVTLRWETRAHLSGVLQEKHRFRAGAPTQGYWLLPDEDNEGKLNFYRREESSDDPTPCEYLRDCLGELELADRCHWWGASDDWSLLEKYAEDEGLELKNCALRYMTLELPTHSKESEWCYHPALGFSMRNN